MEAFAGGEQNPAAEGGGRGEDEEREEPEEALRISDGGFAAVAEAGFEEECDEEEEGEGAEADAVEPALQDARGLRGEGGRGAGECDGRGAFGAGAGVLEVLEVVPARNAYITRRWQR